MELTAAELDTGAGRWAARLRRRGVAAGDRIGLLGTNSPTYLEVVEGAARLGAATVLLNPRLTPADLRFQLDDAGATVALADAALADRLDDALVLDELGEEGADDPVTAHTGLDADRPFIFLYTSGTTGRPKGCVLSRRAWHASMANTAAVLDLRPGDRYLGRAPLFHVAGLSVATATLVYGGTVVLGPTGAMAAADQWDLVARERITVASFVAPLAEVAASAPPATPLRVTFGQGGRWSPEIHAEAADRMPAVAVIGSYGCTEAGNFASRATGADQAARRGTIGRPLASFEAAVVGEDDRPVPAGVAGQLVLRGPSVMSGYWNLPGATADALAGGWLHTGDVMRADEDGYLYFLDRLKDMVKPGGENVYCVEVERTLLSHPAVSQCAVVGVPDARWGEAVKAVVTRRSPVDIEALDRWCLDRMAAYKRPRWYEFVDELPTAAGGKIDKHRLRAEHDPERAVRLPERDLAETE